MQPFVVLGALLCILPQTSLGDDVSNDDSYLAAEQCFDELGLTQEDLNKAFVQNFKLLEGIPKVNEYVACVWKKHGYLDEDGNLNMDRISKLIRDSLSEVLESGENKDQEVEEITGQAMKVCGTIRGVDGGDTAVKVRNCILDHIFKFDARDLSYVLKNILARWLL